jgi:hypothetical protein
MARLYSGCRKSGVTKPLHSFENYRRIASHPILPFVASRARAGGPRPRSRSGVWVGREHFAVCIYHPVRSLTLCWQALKLV